MPEVKAGIRMEEQYLMVTLSSKVEICNLRGSNIRFSCSVLALSEEE